MVDVKAHDRNIESTADFIPGAKAVMMGLDISTPEYRKQLLDMIKDVGAPHGIKILGDFKTLAGQGGDGGRSDVVVMFDSRDIGRLAVSPMHLSGGFSWIDDYAHNNGDLIPADAKHLFSDTKIEEESGVSQEDFESYVEVQKSGVTNMFDVRKVQSLSGLDRETIMDIMKNYGKYKEKFK